MSFRSITATERSITHAIHNIPEVRNRVRTSTNVSCSLAAKDDKSVFSNIKDNTTDSTSFINLSSDYCSRASVIHLIQFEENHLMNGLNSRVAQLLLDPRQMEQMFFCWYVDGRSVESVECSIEDLCVALDKSTIASRLSPCEISILIRRYCEQQRVRTRCCVFVLRGASEGVSLHFIKHYCSSWGAHVILLPESMTNETYQSLVNSLKGTVKHFDLVKFSPPLLEEAVTGVEGSTLETSRLLCEREMIPLYITNVMEINFGQLGRNREDYVESNELARSILHQRAMNKIYLSKGTGDCIRNVVRHRRVKIMKVIVGSSDDSEDRDEKALEKKRSESCIEKSENNEVGKCDQEEVDEKIPKKKDDSDKSELLVDFDKIWFLKAAKEILYNPLYVRILAFILLEKRYDSCELYRAYDGARKAGIGGTPAGTVLRLLETVVSPTDIMALHLLAVLPSHVPRVMLANEVTSSVSRTEANEDSAVPSEGFPSVLVLCRRLILISGAHEKNRGSISSSRISRRSSSTWDESFPERFSDTIWIDTSFQIEYRNELTAQERTRAFKTYFARIKVINDIYPNTFYREYLAVHDRLMREAIDERTGFTEPIDGTDCGIYNKMSVQSTLEERCVDEWTLLSSPLKFPTINNKSTTINEITGLEEQSANTVYSSVRQIQEWTWKRWKRNIKTHFYNEVIRSKIPISDIGVAFPPESCRTFNDIMTVPLLPLEDEDLTPVLCCLYRFYATIFLRRGDPMMAADALERSLAILLYHIGQLYNLLEGEEIDSAFHLSEQNSLDVERRVLSGEHIQQSKNNSDRSVHVSSNSTHKPRSPVTHTHRPKTLSDDDSSKNIRKLSNKDDRSFLYALHFLLIEKTYINLVYCYVAAKKIALSVVYLQKACSILVLLNGNRRDTPARASELLQRNLLLEVMTVCGRKKRDRICSEHIDAADVNSSDDTECFIFEGPERAFCHEAKLAADEALSILKIGTDKRLIGDLVCRCHRLISIAHSYNKEDKLTANHAVLAYQAFMEYIREDHSSGSTLELPSGISYSLGIAGLADHTPLMTAGGGMWGRGSLFEASTRPSIADRQRELEWVRHNRGNFFSALQNRRYTLVNEFLDRSILFTRFGLIHNASDVIVVCGGSPLSEELAKCIIPGPTYQEHLRLYVACTDIEVAHHHGNNGMKSPVVYSLPVHTLLRVMKKGDHVALKLFNRFMQTNIDPNCCSPHDMKTLLHIAIECELTDVVFRLLKHPKVCPSFAAPYLLRSSRRGLSSVAIIEKVANNMTPSPLELCKKNVDLLMALIVNSHKGIVRIFMSNMKFLVESFAATDNGKNYLSFFFEADVKDRGRDRMREDNVVNEQILIDYDADEKEAPIGLLGLDGKHDDCGIKVLDNFRQKGIFSCILPSLIKGYPLCWLEQSNKICVSEYGLTSSTEEKEQMYDDEITTDEQQMKRTAVLLDRVTREQLTVFCKEGDIMACAMYCLDDPFIIIGLIRRYKVCVGIRTVTTVPNGTVPMVTVRSVLSPTSHSNPECSSYIARDNSEADIITRQQKTISSVIPYYSSMTESAESRITYADNLAVFRNNMRKLLTACIKREMYATAAAVLTEVPDDCLNINMMDYDDIVAYRNSGMEEYRRKFLDDKMLT